MKTSTHLYKLSLEAEELSPRQRLLELLASRAFAIEKRRALKTTMCVEWTTYYHANEFADELLAMSIQANGGLHTAP